MRDTAGDLPLFGQQAWNGILLTGPWSFRDDGTGRATTIGLEHGDPDDESVPWLRVLSTCDPADHLVRELRFERTLGDRGATGPVDRETVRASRRRTDVSSAESQVEIMVDGQPRTFRRWDTGERWYAAWEPDHEHAIVIAARHLDPADVALVPVHDIEPYLAGRRDWIRAREQAG
ncbi:hypothetical protein GCM10009676_24220 [Prauserella halophila]|uniref:Uncharacterized protein n=2 Tax=Prauserella halophila TaxID=185641 RepID=A0ABP4GWM3_9PSEU|nr:hypothetical protein [Prauserella halophila]